MGSPSEAAVIRQQVVIDFQQIQDARLEHRFLSDPFAQGARGSQRIVPGGDGISGTLGHPNLEQGPGCDPGAVAAMNERGTLSRNAKYRDSRGPQSCSRGAFTGIAAEAATGVAEFAERKWPRAIRTILLSHEDRPPFKLVQQAPRPSVGPHRSTVTPMTAIRHAVHQHRDGYARQEHGRSLPYRATKTRTRSGRRGSSAGIK